MKIIKWKNKFTILYDGASIQYPYEEAKKAGLKSEKKQVNLSDFLSFDKRIKLNQFTTIILKFI